MSEIVVNLKEKIGAGLAACLPRTKAEAQMGCRECPYRGGVCKECVDIPTEILEDMRALLKALEPHIVTIADYENNPNVDKDGNLAVWRESRHLNGIAYHNDGWVILNRIRAEGWFNSEMIRFWTSRPTDEQRETVKWE